MIDSISNWTRYTLSINKPTITMYNKEFPSTPRTTPSTDASFRSHSQPPRTPFPRNQSRRQPHPSPRSSHAQPRTQQDMYSSDHGARVNFPLNADAMVFEPSSMSECVQVMKGHVDGFAIALNAICNDEISRQRK